MSSPFFEGHQRHVKMIEIAHKSPLAAKLFNTTSTQEFIEARKLAYAEIQRATKLNIDETVIGFFDTVPNHPFFNRQAPIDTVRDMMGTFIALAFQIGNSQDINAIRQDAMERYNDMFPGVIHADFEADYAQEQHPLDIFLELGEREARKATREHVGEGRRGQSVLPGDNLDVSAWLAGLRKTGGLN